MSGSFADIRGVFVDMDGTLADTARDIVPLLNGLLEDEGLPPLEYVVACNHVSKGARVLIRLGFGKLDATREDALLTELLQRYAAAPCEHGTLYEGMPELLTEFERRSLPWGIVSNKMESLVVAVAERLPLPYAPVCILGGDSLPRRKPHPDQLLEAARRVGLDATSCLYLGDDPRDMQAAAAAGMIGVVAGFGYIEPDTDLESWGGDAIIQHPQELLTLLGEKA